MSFEEALHNFKEPPTYEDPTKLPEPKEKKEVDFHDEDDFGDDYNEKSYGGWPNAPYGADYYNLVIHTLLRRGVVPAPEKIRQLYWAVDKKNPDVMADIAYVIRGQLSNAGDDTQAPEGWVSFEAHERGTRIRTLIEGLPQNIVDNYWLLPVEDNGEYVSWDFIFVPRDEERVIKQLMALSVS